MTPQEAIFLSDSADAHHYLEFKLHSNIKLNAIKSALSSILNLQLAPMVVGFGKDLWNNINPQWSPKELQNFQPIVGDKHAAPCTQRDLFFWIHNQNSTSSAVYDQAYEISQVLKDIGDICLDIPAFTYHDSRDLIGFVDGSANPKEEARYQVALIPEGEVGAGGSYVLTQKWVHHLESFKSLEEKEQVQVIGRTKPDSIELEGSDMPKNSHVSRTDVKVDGTAMKVYRRSKPYGNTQEKGLFFLSFACELRRHQIQLERMYGVAEDRIQDRILDYSTATTGSYWFVPSKEDLEQIPHN